MWLTCDNINIYIQFDVSCSFDIHLVADFTRNMSRSTVAWHQSKVGRWTNSYKQLTLQIAKFRHLKLTKSNLHIFSAPLENSFLNTNQALWLTLCYRGSIRI